MSIHLVSLTSTATVRAHRAAGGIVRVRPRRLGVL